MVNACGRLNEGGWFAVKDSAWSKAKKTIQKAFMV